MNQTELKSLVSGFMIDGPVVSVDSLGAGFINDTFVVRTAEGFPDYILQRKNHNIFPDVPGMMDNIYAVTSHIKSKVNDPLRETLTVVPARNGKLYVEHDGNFWAVCLFIPGSMTYERADTLELAYQGGVGIGQFQSLLADFDKPLNETIKGFHNIRWRFVQWDEAVKADSAGRVKDLAEEIGWIESRREEMMRFWALVENCTIPKRVTHNDTKLSNILFDEESGKVLCAIDLDTVMTSTSLNDFGDSIRSYANTGAEDDRNLDNVSLDLERFRAFTEGYLSQRLDTMTESELEWLAFSARYITFEQVLRFLMDYIDGDRYYRIHYPEHNIVRTHSQYRLLCSMEQQYEQMCQIVSRLAGRQS